jgi:hypothetical protein
VTNLRQFHAVLLALLLCSCATKTVPRERTAAHLALMEPPEPLVTFAMPAAGVAAVPQPPKPLALYWEHTTVGASGFVIERAIAWPEFSVVGFVPVTSPWATNANDFTFRFGLTNEPPGQAFYRVGAMPVQ